MKRAAVVFAVVLLVLAAGCGGGGVTPADEISDAVKDLATNARAHKWDAYCAGTTGPDQCLGTIATLQAEGVDMADAVPSDDLLDRMRVKVTGDRATVDTTGSEDAVWVRSGDRWLFEWPQ